MRKTIAAVALVLLGATTAHAENPGLVDEQIQQKLAALGITSNSNATGNFASLSLTMNSNSVPGIKVTNPGEHLQPCAWFENLDNPAGWPAVFIDGFPLFDRGTIGAQLQVFDLRNAAAGVGGCIGLCGKDAANGNDTTFAGMNVGMNVGAPNTSLMTLGNGFAEAWTTGNDTGSVDLSLSRVGSHALGVGNGGIGDTSGTLVVAICSTAVTFKNGTTTGADLGATNTSLMSCGSGFAIAWTGGNNNASATLGLSSGGSGILDVGTGAAGNAGGTVNCTTITMAGKLTTYNGIATAGLGVPAIVSTGHQHLTNGTNTSEASYSVPADGFYEVGAEVTTVSGSNFNFQVEVSWTYDESNAVSQDLLYCKGTGAAFVIQNSDGTPHDYPMCPLVVYAKSGTTISVGAFGTFTSVVFDLGCWIKRIS